MLLTQSSSLNLIRTCTNPHLDRSEDSLSLAWDSSLYLPWHPCPSFSCCFCLPAPSVLAFLLFQACFMPLWCVISLTGMCFVSLPVTCALPLVHLLSCAPSSHSHAFCFSPSLFPSLSASPGSPELSRCLSRLPSLGSFPLP